MVDLPTDDLLPSTPHALLSSTPDPSPCLPVHLSRAVWELYCKATAFKDYHYGEVFERVALGGERPPVPVGMPEGYTLLMTSCWAADPLLRPGFQSIVQCLQMMLDQQAVPEQMLATVSRGGAAEGEGGGAAALPPLPEGLCSPYIGDL